MTIFYCFLQALATLEFLTDALENKHVSIHSHTHREHDTGNTRQGQNATERSEDTEYEEDVEQEGCISDKARNQTIVENHVDEDKAEGDNERNQTSLNRLSTKRRTYDIFLNNACRSRHLTRLEGVCQVLCLINGEITGDL